MKTIKGNKRRSLWHKCGARALVQARAALACRRLKRISVNVAYDPKTDEKSTSFDFGKGVSEQVKTNTILGEIYKELANLDVS